MGLRSVSILPQHYMASQNRKFDLKHHRRESLKTRGLRKSSHSYRVFTQIDTERIHKANFPIAQISSTK